MLWPQSILTFASGNLRSCAAQSRIYDERIAYHQECIRGLNEERNKLMPISRVPPEILANVFSFVVAGHTRTLEEDFPFPLYYFTHVSRSWRSVGLTTPQLWRVIMPVGGRFSIALLERSKAVDLVILLKGGRNLVHHSPASMSLLKLVLTKHASRIRELVININYSLAALFGDLQHPLRLHSLQLGSYEQFATFPTDVVETDSLRILDVEYCDGPWFSMSLPALTTLRVHKIYNRPPLSGFLEMLRGLAALQVLDMEDSLPFAIDPDRATRLMDPIHLPSLQYLRLSRNIKEVSNILSRITVPPTANLRFALTNITNNIDALSTFSAFLSRMGPSLSYSILHIRDDFFGCITIQAWSDGTGSGSSVAPNLDVTAPRKVVLENIFPSLLLFNITTLTLNTGRTGEFIKELSRNIDESSDYYSVPFPALEFLWIQEGDFSKKKSRIVEELQDCLMERYERKAELLKLKFTHCHKLYHSHLEKLREIVVDVEADSFLVSDSDSDSE